MQIGFAAPPAGGAGAIAVGANERDLLPAAQAVDRQLNGALRRAADTSRFKGKPGQVVELLAPSGIQASRILLLGAGPADKFDGPAAEKLAAGAIARLLTSGETDLLFRIDLPKSPMLKRQHLAAHLALGAQLRSYSFHKYRTKQRDEHEPTLANV